MSITYSTPTNRNTQTHLPAHLKLTPTSSPLLRSTHAPKSPLKRSLTDTKETLGMNLKRMIGTTTSSPTGLASHAPSGSIAFCTGAAVCVVRVDEHLQIKGRYFLRARPSAGATTANAGTGSAPSTPESSTNRVRASIGGRDSIGFSPNRDFESPGKDGDKNWSVRDRVKAATTVCFSPDGKYVAVGETGHNPRVLIYNVSAVDMNSGNDILPFAILTDHTYGVRSVAFSPCSQYLASIGTMNDGCLYIWSMPAKGTQVKLHSSNRCTSSVQGIAWMGKSLITVGLRHVKIWKMEEEVVSPQTQQNSKSLHSILEKFSHSKTKQPSRPQGPTVLNGRNAILGPLLEELFISVTSISSDRAIIATEKGDICVIDEGLQRVTKVATAEPGVTCVAVDKLQQFAWIAGRQGSIRTLKLQDIANPLTPPESPSSRSGSPILPTGCKPANVIAMTNLGQHLFLIDANRSIKVVGLKYHEGLPAPDSVAYEFPAHKSPVYGVRLMPPSAHIQADFFTWSACGTIMFWDNDGNHIQDVSVELEQPKELDDEVRNELKVVEMSDNGELIVTGDKFGVLRVIRASDQACVYAAKAHAGEIMSITVHEGEKATLVSSCARDRTVQLFTKMKKPVANWTLSQTLDDHTASVTRVTFMDKGTKLLSASADRTIVIRDIAMKEKENGDIDLLAFLAGRTIMLKATPLHMTPFSDSSPLLMVTTTGRQVYRFDINTGKEIHMFKCVDESGESVIMDSLTVGRDVSFSKSRLMAGISSTDKSIRIYDMQGNLIEREWGHTEGVTDIALFESPGSTEDGRKLTLISTGSDGTVMMWTYNAKVRDSDAESIGPDTTASKAPIRKVLSKAEILELTNRERPETSHTYASGTGKSRDKENRSATLGTDWAGSDTDSSASLRKVETHPGTTSTTTSTSTAAPPSQIPTQVPRTRLSERPKSVINVSPPRPPPKNHRNSVAYIPKSSSTAPSKLVAPSNHRERPISPKPPKGEASTDTEASTTSSTVRRKLRLPSRSRDPSPAPSTHSLKTGGKNAAGTSRRSSFGSRTTSLRSGGNREASDAANANALAEQMTRSLGVFRRRVESSQYAMKADARKELEKELLATLKAIGCAPPTPSPTLPQHQVRGTVVTPVVNVSDEGMVSPRSFSGVSGTVGGADGADGLGIRMDEPMMVLLNTYSERLLSVIENRLDASGGNSPRNSFSGSTGSGRGR